MSKPSGESEPEERVAMANPSPALAVNYGLAFVELVAVVIVGVAAAILHFAGKRLPPWAFACREGGISPLVFGFSGTGMNSRFSG